MSRKAHKILLETEETGSTGAYFIFEGTLKGSAVHHPCSFVHEKLKQRLS